MARHTSPDAGTAAAPFRRVFAAAVVCGAVAAMSACYYPGGPGYSADQHTYESTAWQPWTVTVRDTRTGEAVWSLDVPVGQQLVVRFREGRGTDDQHTPDMMQWDLMPVGKRFGQGLHNSVPVPPSHARRLEPELRAVPELPADMEYTRRPADDHGSERDSDNGSR